MTTKLSPSPAPLHRGKTRPKHATLTDDLRDLIGSLRPGDKLPPQDELMRAYRVSDSTVLRSLDDLQRAGWVVRRRGSGTFVADRSDRATENRAGLEAAAPGVPIPTPRQSTENRTVSLIARYTFAASYMRLCADLLGREAEAQGFSLVCRAGAIHLSPADAPSLEVADALGFLFLGYAMVDTALALAGRGHRVVVIGTPPAGEDTRVPCVCADHEWGGGLAARHLLGCGHDPARIAFAYDNQLPCAPQDHPRFIGHAHALRDASARTNAGAPDEMMPVCIGPETLAAWRENSDLAAAYFCQPNAPTAIAAWNDSIALMLLGVLHRAGLRVPADVSVIGFDAVPDGMDSVPPLSTVEQHMDWQVRAALRLLIRETVPPAQTVMVLPELKSRASCGPPPDK